MSWNAEIQSMWLGGITCAWLARLFGTTLNEEGFNAQSVCVCVSYAWVKLCVCTCCMGICWWITLTCCRVLTCDWRQQVVWVGVAAPRVFFTSKYLFFHWTAGTFIGLNHRRMIALCYLISHSSYKVTQEACRKILKAQNRAHVDQHSGMTCLCVQLVLYPSQYWHLL